MQIVSANVQIMNDDVRRMFTFGITIECDEVTLWFHCRSHSADSKPFSFVDEPKKLIKVFICILFATDEELGYDPLITLDDDSEYVFDMSKKGGSVRLFRTVEPIAIYRSNNITGRMTRIFKVTEANSNPPKTFVLKDVWIEETAQTESQIQQAIFDGIERFWTITIPEDKKGLESLKSKHAKLVDRKDYKNFFLSIETDLLGSVSKKNLPLVIGPREAYFIPSNEFPHLH
ncbi:hypothetical protein CVT25_012520 [Psilocybe cyanescens]|uniref:Fungal-type protein kinase domain-containing protein n=1 Tax=Psilocybe cyanescens TaxID=93625 RepID=A0A409VX49_PSICY|nr:hypothetical protein CVT25_012520 [Psilocybe cyanescens]